MMDKELERKAFEHAMNAAGHSPYLPDSAWLGWQLAMKHLREQKDNPVAIDPQNTEFAEVEQLATDYRRLLNILPSHFAYPKARAAYERSITGLIDAMRANNRFLTAGMTMTKDQRLVYDEVRKAAEKFPTWPTDPLHAIGVVNEEVGELNKAILQAVYEPNKNPQGVASVTKEAVQAAAMLMRFIASLGRYHYTSGSQHTQDRA